VSKRKSNKKAQKSAITSLVVILFLLLGLSGGFWMLLNAYPLEYEDLVREYAAEYDLDPALVAGVICTESHFKADAESHKGATGLMQLMPDTAEWVASKLKEEYDPAALTDPKTNIRYGCWYLDYLSGKFDGDQTLICAAYNAGPGTVDRWLKDPQVSPEGEPLAHIPYPETASYVKKVDRAHDIYKIFYGLS